VLQGIHTKRTGFPPFVLSTVFCYLGGHFLTLILGIVISHFFLVENCQAFLAKQCSNHFRTMVIDTSFAEGNNYKTTEIYGFRICNIITGKH
jgi:hypothetical protein